MDIQSLPEHEANTGSYIYDEATLNMLRKRRKEYLADKSILSPVEESMKRMQAQRKRANVD